MNNYFAPNSFLVQFNVGGIKIQSFNDRFSLPQRKQTLVWPNALLRKSAQ